VSYHPVVSVIVPMLNEADTIRSCIGGLDAQLWPPALMDVVVIDGGSTDGSREVVGRLQADRPWLRLMDNPDRRAAAAFNRGVEAAKGEIVCLLSAHGEVGPTFIADSVRVLEETGAAGVGGVVEHSGTDRRSRAIGLAMTSRFGMASPFRYGRERREVDTIGHPAYRLDALRDVGGFAEDLERNSDYELNYRLRDAGYALLFEPSIVTHYRPRETLTDLAGQFWWYGRWKAHVVRRHPGSLQPRHLVPPFATLAALMLPLALRWPSGRRAALAVGGAYGAAVLAATVAARPAERDASRLTLATAFPVMHGSWGAGFLWTVVRRWR
jgi:succinoglycan biosynthesis protein ExoA